MIVAVGFSERTCVGRSVGANINQDSLQVGKDVFFGHVDLCRRANRIKTLQPNKMYFMFLLVSVFMFKHYLYLLHFSNLLVVQFSLLTCAAFNVTCGAVFSTRPKLWYMFTDSWDLNRNLQQK